MSAPDPDTNVVAAQARQAIRTDMLLGIDQVLLRSEQVIPLVETEPANTRVAERRPAPAPPAPASARKQPTIELSEEGSAAERLAALDSLHASTCPHCTSATTHTQLVFGEGAPDAELMFVGEAPGAEEDRTGRPFVGPAGQKLDAMIEAMGFQRSDVYIANVLKSRPPSNRTPLEHEIEGCSPFLAEQVRIIQPTAIVTLGGPASKLLLDTQKGITRLRGVWGTYHAGALEVPVMPTFHPAYLLRNYTHEVRAQVWGDLKQVLTRLGRELPD